MESYSTTYHSRGGDNVVTLPYLSCLTQGGNSLTQVWPPTPRTFTAAVLGRVWYFWLKNSQSLIIVKNVILFIDLIVMVTLSPPGEVQPKFDLAREFLPVVPSGSTCHVVCDAPLKIQDWFTNAPLDDIVTRISHTRWCPGHSSHDVVVHHSVGCTSHTTGMLHERRRLTLLSIIQSITGFVWESEKVMSEVGGLVRGAGWGLGAGVTDSFTKNSQYCNFRRGQLHRPKPMMIYGLNCQC